MPSPQPTLLHVRYYDQNFHPDEFRRRGWRGSLIRFLNWVRYWLETLLQRVLVSLLLREGGVPAKRGRLFVGEFWKDVDREQAFMRANSPLVEKDPEAEVLGDERTDPRRLRHTKGRVQLPVESNVPDRPKPLDEMVSRYGGTTRARSYGHGQTIVREDDGFEPLSATANPTETARLVALDRDANAPVVVTQKFEGFRSLKKGAE